LKRVRIRRIQTTRLIIYSALSLRSRRLSPSAKLFTSFSDRFFQPLSSLLLFSLHYLKLTNLRSKLPKSCMMIAPFCLLFPLKLFVFGYEYWDVNPQSARRGSAHSKLNGTFFFLLFFYFSPFLLIITWFFF
jgi:hypothetical protein